MRFTKLQGAGNDYLFVDGANETRDWSEISRKISDRHFGVGSDGLIVVGPSEKADARMRMYNADGSEGEMCGNGIRCFTKYVLERGLVEGDQESLSVETGAGVLTIKPLWQGDAVTGARVNMGEPTIRAADVPVEPDNLGPSNLAALDHGLLESLGVAPGEIVFDAALTVQGRVLPGTAVSMGNPHFTVLLDEPVVDFPLLVLGPEAEHAPAFPNRVNFHVANVLSRDRMISRTWERGSGATLACGTGACAMVVAARLHSLVDDRVTVEVPGGELTITWPGHGPVMMEGDAVEVFSIDWPA